MADLERISATPFHKLNETDASLVVAHAATGQTRLLELVISQRPPNITLIAAMGGIARLQAMEQAHNGSKSPALDHILKISADALDEAWEHLEASEAQFRLGGIYMRYLEAHPDADWVMVGNETGEVYGGGRDAQMPDEEAFDLLQSAVEERVHLFGRPVFIETDGLVPDFD